MKGMADLKGSLAYPKISGHVEFYEWGNGTLIKAEVHHLPDKELNNFFGFHIHENGNCGNPADFMDAGSHYRKGKTLHPQHDGDLTMLYSNNGYAFLSMFTQRFQVSEIIGRTVVIHEGMDDFKTDPAGNSGKRIACGSIKKEL